jgi:hypothetical protein
MVEKEQGPHCVVSHDGFSHDPSHGRPPCTRAVDRGVSRRRCSRWRVRALSGDFFFFMRRGQEQVTCRPERCARRVLVPHIAVICHRRPDRQGDTPRTCSARREQEMQSSSDPGGPTRRRGCHARVAGSAVSVTPGGGAAAVSMTRRTAPGFCSLETKLVDNAVSVFMVPSRSHSQSGRRRSLGGADEQRGWPSLRTRSGS